MGMEAFERHLPYYLTQSNKDALKKALNDFKLDKKVDYFLGPKHTPDYILQGDICSGLPIINYETGKKRLITGVILTNTCDISPDNKRDLPSKVTFVPIIKLNKYKEILINAGIEEKKVEAKIDSIKAQVVTNLFYVPHISEQDPEEGIVLLSDASTIPYEICIDKNAEFSRLKSLSNFGFYLFIFKLSLHFCRFQEEVIR